MRLHALLAVLVASILCAGSPAVAQVALQGGTVHTAAGAPIPDGIVLIGADGNIAAVGANVALPAGTTVIDVAGKVVTPGFVESSTQLGLLEIAAVKSTRDADAGPIDPAPDPVRAAFLAVDGFNPASANIAIQRLGGVTSALVMPSGGIVAGQGAFVDLVADRGDATVVRPSAAMAVHVGQLGESPRGVTLLRLRELFDDAKFFRANAGRFDENRSRDLSASRLDFLALNGAVDAGRPFHFEADRASDIVAVLNFATENGLRPVIVGGAEAWQVTDELKAADATVIVQPYYNLPWSFDMLGARADNAALLEKAGVPVAISAFDTHHSRNLRYLAGNAVRAGMSPDAALAAITLNAARTAGMEQTHGSIEVGKVANVVVWTGDPFEFESRIDQMFVRGVDVPLESRQSKLFERYRELDRRAEPAAVEKAAPPKEN